MNKIQLIGRLGKDPEMTYTPSGSPVTKFSLATDRKWKDKTSGETKSETTWFNIVAWERLAETCSNYLHKGDKVYVEGRVVIRDYTDKDNVQRRAFDVVMTEMEMLSDKPKNGNGAGNGGAAPGTSEGEDFPF